MAAIIPRSPWIPTLTSITEVRIRVIRVMPETGLLPTIAIALAATVVKRKAMTNTIRRAMSVCDIL